jgi:glycosyltransferase involved in cell wall biosynthesis
MMAQPLVSCIMPTYNRRRFVPQAIRYFLRQDYPWRELLIVDDGEDPIGDLVPDDERIRYVRLERRQSVGAKRNLACQMSRGELIAHWDDDDWFAPQRLRVQVTQLLAAGADVCGARELLYYDLQAGKAWLYRYPLDRRPWLIGGTLLYRRSAWAAHRFPDRNVGEDTGFVWQLAPERLHAFTDRHLYIAIIHGANTGAKRPSSPRWERLPLNEISPLLVSDRAFYVALRNGTPWPEPAPRSKRAGGPSARAGLSRRDTSACRVTVSIPYFRCKPYVRRSVESILDQTHTNLLAVVVNDGDEDPPWDELAHIDDPRLVRFDLRENRGRYFVDAVVLNATPDSFFLIQDADDWSEPDRISVLLSQLREDGADGAVSSLYRHRFDNGRTIAERKESYAALNRPLTENLRHRASHAGLFRSESLKRIGGYYGGFRIGYDTQIMSLLLMVGRISYVDRPLYNRLVRPDSLTGSRATGLKSPARNQVHRQLQETYSEAYGQYTRYLGGEIGKEALCKFICQIRSKHLPQDAHTELQQASGRLRAVLRSGCE